MMIHLFCIFLLIGGGSTKECDTAGDCGNPFKICNSNGNCGECNSDNQCLEQHTKRTICANNFDPNRCVQCMSDMLCGSGETCVTAQKTYLCAVSCTGPSVTCSSDSQCIYIPKDNGNEGDFYCLSCENNADCRKWSGSSSSTCNSGICSPAFVSCGKNEDCPSITSSNCNDDKVCKPCSKDSQCSRFTDTPVCDSGVCVQCKTHSDCPSASMARCKDHTCISCNSNDNCAHLTSTPVCKNPGSSGVCVPCVANTDCLTAIAPQCSEETNTCIACTESSHCLHLSSSPVCKDPGAGCVQCVSDSDCPNAAAAQCTASNICVPCTENGHCTHLSSKSICKDPGTAGTCVQCLSNSDCPTESAAKCSESNTCVPCTDSSQCTRFNSTPICNSTMGRCVECGINKDCTTIEKPNCLEILGHCGPCQANGHCSRFPETRVCRVSDPANKLCVQCIVDKNCTNPTAAQCSGSNTCIPCTQNTHCAHLSATPVCKDLGEGGTCVQCVDHSDCHTAAAARCLSNTCTTCTLNSQCARLAPNSLCNTISGECVECLSISNCTDGKICSPSGACVPCTDSTQCTLDSALFCNNTIGKCVECLVDADCSSTTASHCSLDNNTCVSCTDSSHCKHLTSTTVCTIVGSSPGLCTPKCVPYCLQCFNDSACKVCLPGHYLLNTSACLTTCPEGYWKNTQAMSCDMCDATCKTCEINAGKCTSCFTPYVLDGSKCIPPLGNSPPTVTLKSSSDPQTFLLVFSNPMAITSEILMESLQFSLSNMNSSDFSLLNITAQPDSKTFKLTFNFTKSMGIETLTVTFENKGIILDKDGLIINQDSVSAKTIRFTFFSQEEKAAAEALTSIGSTVSNTALASSAGMFLAGGGGMLWTFLGIFQIVNYLLYLNVNYPYNVVAFFQLFSISSIEGLLPNPVEYVAPALYEDMQVGLPSPPKFADNEMDGLFLNNAGATLAGWIVIGALYGCSKLILFTFRTWGRFNRIITTFKEKFEWGFVYNALIGTYPELIIASCLQFVNMDFTTHINRFSSIAALIVGACCFWAPFTVTAALESSAEVLGTEFHEKKHGAFYEDFIVDSQKKVSPETAYYRRNFMAFIFLRKMAYFSGIVLAYDIPILQMLISCCSGLVLLVFMIKVKPYRNKRDAWMNMGSEVIMVMIHLVIFLFAGDDITQKMSDTQRKNVGWVVIILCCLLVAYNAFFIFTQQVLALWKGLKLLIHVLCKKKKKEEDQSSSNHQKSRTSSSATDTQKVIKTKFLGTISTSNAAASKTNMRQRKILNHCARKRRLNLNSEKNIKS